MKKTRKVPESGYLQLCSEMAHFIRYDEFDDSLKVEGYDRDFGGL